MHCGIKAVCCLQALGVLYNDHYDRDIGQQFNARLLVVFWQMTSLMPQGRSLHALMHE